ncbi:MAG: FAD:protein FMN transferase [Alphaproteobacteria bacterium]|nr:MAG: FAD:protein FMN transferase [Alphaproteobacteria bacterium]
MTHPDGPKGGRRFACVQEPSSRGRDMAVPMPSRRRVLQLVAVSPLLALLPGMAFTQEAAPIVWRGRLMGAEAALSLYARDRDRAEESLEEAIVLARRLEGLFSLYRSDSALVVLNETGRLHAPPRDFLALMQAADHFHRLTDGAFNPLVGALFDLYLAHFASRPGDERGPSSPAIAKGCRLLTWRKLRYDRRSVQLPRGARLTFNGIAQGYVTDRVAALLARKGWMPALVNFGEYRALGRHPSGRPFMLGLADPLHPGQVLGRLPVSRALAASSPLAARFDEAGRFHHLLDPRTGRPAVQAPAGLWVAAGNATTADALSTALSVMTRTERRRLLGRLSGVTAWQTTGGGTLQQLKS